MSMEKNNSKAKEAAKAYCKEHEHLRNISVKDIEEIFRKYEAGEKTVTQLITIYGERAAKYIAFFRKYAGITSVSRPNRKTAVIDEAIEQNIVKDYNSCEYTLKEICKKHNVYEDRIYKILNKYHIPYKTDISKQEYIAARAAAQAVALNETRNTENAAVEIAVKATTASHEARKIKIKDLKRVHAKKHAKVAAKKKKIQWVY